LPGTKAIVVLMALRGSIYPGVYNTLTALRGLNIKNTIKI